MENKKKVKVISFVSAMMLFVIVVAAAFAYFSNMSAGLANNVAVNVTALEGGDSVFSSNATQLSINIPASSMDSSYANNETAIAENTATLSVNLISGDDNQYVSCTYDIVYEYDYNSNVYGDETTYVTKDGDTGANVTKEITMQVSGPSTGTNNYNEEKNFNYDSSWTTKDTINLVGAKRVLVSNAVIKNMSSTEQTTQNWTFTGKYYNLDIFQTQLSNQAFTGKIYVSNKKCDLMVVDTSKLGTAGSTIIANNGGINSIMAKGTPAFTTVATTNEGMYVTEDDYGTSYYFRGAVDNNWVKFGKDSTGKDIYWRIIRINGDGSIRMIYTGTTAPTESTKVVMTGTGISKSAFYSYSAKVEYVGYQYIKGQQHGYGECNGTSASCTVNGSTVYNSTIKQAIDKWYAGTTLEKDTATKALVSQDQMFCNDRSVTDGTWSSSPTSNLYYAAHTRLSASTPIPQLKCPTASDKFTVNVSNGNGALTYPVGLITADEVAMAGGKWATANSSYYLYINNDYWSGSPSYFYSGIGFANELIVNSSGNVGADVIQQDDDLARPVVSLSSKAKLSGNGTYSKPYTVN